MPYIMRRKLRQTGVVDSKCMAFERPRSSPSRSKKIQRPVSRVIERKGEEVDAVPVLESPETEEVRTCFR